jgi:hypothetical protein
MVQGGSVVVRGWLDSCSAIAQWWFDSGSVIVQGGSVVVWRWSSNSQEVVR